MIPENIRKLLKSKSLNDVKLGILLYMKFNNKTPLKKIYEELDFFPINVLDSGIPSPEHHIKRSKRKAIIISSDTGNIRIIERTHLIIENYKYSKDELF